MLHECYELSVDVCSLRKKLKFMMEVEREMIKQALKTKLLFLLPTDPSGLGWEEVEDNGKEVFLN